MAKINTVFGFVDNITNPLKRMNSALKNTEGSFNKIQAAIITANSAMALFSMAKGGVDKLTASIAANVQAYQYQAEQELKLETIMKKRMNATQADIQYVKDLARAEQQLGIYGDEMILQGAQELASFTSSKEAIAQLVPAMNNLIAQQYGYKASGMDFQHTADMMGKVLSGQTGALSRLGYIFSEEEKQMLKTGNEMQRAATLAKIITDNVGDMNHALAGTDAGQIQNVANRLGDLREDIGKTLMPLQSAVSRLKNAITGDFLVAINNALGVIVPIFVKLLDGITAVYNAIKNLINKIRNAFNSFVQGMIKNLNSLAVALGIIGAAVAAFGTIWVAVHAKMLAVTIATTAKTVALWIAAHAKMLAVHIASMAKMAAAWFVGLGPVGWIIAGIIALVIGLIAVCVKMGATFEKVGRAIGKVFGAIYAAGYNAIMALINKFIELQNVIANSFIGQKLGMKAWELKEYKDIRATMEAGAEKGGEIGKGMDDWIKGLQNRLNPQIISEGIQNGLSFTGNGELSVSDKNLVEVAEDYKELLTKRAIQRFNLQYKTVTPEINIQKVDVHKEADAGKSLSLLSNMLGEYADSSLRAVG